jgi:hypothetical protein
MMLWDERLVVKLVLGIPGSLWDERLVVKLVLGIPGSI